jgi:hypothetical protein
LGTDQEHLHVGALAVHALGARRRQRVTPEILHVLNMGGVGIEFADDLVLEDVCAVAKFVLALQNHHRRGVRIKLLEHLADPHHRLERRGICRAYWHRVLIRDLPRGGVIM